ncbi:Uncharacterised protein [Klebsiella pneumoniae]|nr:Uncharacterised protein [Shigella sonnei]SWL66522.1 Uncharacterised protein [Klebsiella pneumoniae]
MKDDTFIQIMEATKVYTINFLFIMHLRSSLIVLSSKLLLNQSLCSVNT